MLLTETPKPNDYYSVTTITDGEVKDYKSRILYPNSEIIVDWPDNPAGKVIREIYQKIVQIIKEGKKPVRNTTCRVIYYSNTKEGIAQLEVSGFTIKGNSPQHPKQQDSSATPITLNIDLTEVKKFGFPFVIADGGLENGELVSRKLTENFIPSFYNTVLRKLHLQNSSQFTRENLRKCFEEIDSNFQHELVTLGSTDTRYSEAVSTYTLGLIFPDKDGKQSIFIVNRGNSLCYVFPNMSDFNRQISSAQNQSGDPGNITGYISTRGTGTSPLHNSGIIQLPENTLIIAGSYNLYDTLRIQELGKIVKKNNPNNRRIRIFRLL